MKGGDAGVGAVIDLEVSGVGRGNKNDHVTKAGYCPSNENTIGTSVLDLWWLSSIQISGKGSDEKGYGVVGGDEGTGAENILASVVSGVEGDRCYAVYVYLRAVGRNRWLIVRRMKGQDLRAISSACLRVGLGRSGRRSSRPVRISDPAT